MRWTAIVWVVLIGLATVAAVPGSEAPLATGDEADEAPSFSGGGYAADGLIGSGIEEIPASWYQRPPPDLDRISLEIPVLRPLPASYEGARDPRQRSTRGTALASADFDEDGVPDLVSGYAATGGGLVAIHRGNIDSIFPHTPEARERRRTGTFTDEPFLSPALVFETPSSPDFIAAGDFDNDGHADVIAATRGDTRVYLLAGDSTGDLGTARSVPVPGAITAMTAGEVNRRDGIPDLVLGIAAAEGHRILILQGPEGALQSNFRVAPVDSEVTALALARINDDAISDLAVAAGGALLMVPGVETTDDAVETRRLATFGSPIVSIAGGDFASENVPRDELAVLTEDGYLRILGAEQGWMTIREQSVVDPGPGSSRLIQARVSGLPTEDLIVVDPDTRSITLLSGMTHDEPQGLMAEGVVRPTGAGGHIADIIPMRLTSDALTDLVVLDEAAGSPSILATESRATIVVTSVFDTDIPGDAQCTLREAIKNSNGDSETTGGDCEAGSGVDEINFNIAGGGNPATISVSSALPTISDPVTIDGGTQGCSSPPCIEIEGTAAGVTVSGLVLDSGNSTVRGLVINRFGLQGIQIGSSGNYVENCYIGTDLAGSSDLGNGIRGILLIDGSDNTIGGSTLAARNVISGNGGFGIYIVRSAVTPQDNAVLGNLIGLDATGTADLGNASVGVHLANASSNTIGGTAPGARNIISGNDSDGIYINLADSQHNLVFGNYIGTDISGTLDLGNDLAGVEIDRSPNNTVGGTAPGAGNLISGNDLMGVLVDHTSGTDVLGNLIGTDVTGTLDLGNTTYGVDITGSSDSSVGGTTPGARNIISGNDSRGVYLRSVSTGNKVLGNYIGTDITGTIDLGNSSSGVRLAGSPGNTIGGTAPEARNIVSGNDGNGIHLVGGSNSNLIQGNYIGTDVTGTSAIGNTFVGVMVHDSSHNTIGGTGPGARNIVSGNGIGVAFELTTGLLTNNSVLGNFIGTDVTGTIDLGNEQPGVWIELAPDNIIGGTAPGAPNVISGNDESGVYIRGATAKNNQIIGNYIGTDLSGILDLGNTFAGVHIVEAASHNTIGGITADAGNMIAHNGNEGVVAESGIGNALLGNSVFSNGLMGIDLGASDGITPNDPNDPDTGPNNLQNFPVLTLASATPNPDVTVEGSLNSLPLTSYRIEFFANTVCDSAGCGEGERFLGATDQTTDGNGDVSFSLTLTAPVADGEAIVATATDPANSTSEFAVCIDARCSTLATFNQTIVAPDKNGFDWLVATDIRYAKGNLADLATYTTTGGGWIAESSSLDISGDSVAPGQGLYYLVESLGCGSWQSAPGAEPDRDIMLP